MFLDRFNILIVIKNKKNILIYFQIKKHFKNNIYHTLKQTHHN
jgi:hypothetical protein